MPGALKVHIRCQVHVRCMSGARQVNGSSQSELDIGGRETCSSLHLSPAISFLNFYSFELDSEVGRLVVI